MSKHVDKKQDSAPGPADLFGVQVNCEEAVHELYTYLDGELTEVRREEIRIHLDYCGLRGRGRVRGGAAQGDRQPVQGPRARKPDPPGGRGHRRGKSAGRRRALT